MKSDFCFVSKNKMAETSLRSFTEQSGRLKCPDQSDHRQSLLVASKGPPANMKERHRSDAAAAGTAHVPPVPV